MVYRIPPRQGEFVYSGDVYQALIPKDHFLREVNAAIGFSFTNEECRSLYCPDNGRPTTNYPEKMLRAEFLQYYYELSDREMEERARCDLAFRWFLGLGAMNEAFEFSALSEFRKRLGPEMHKTLFDQVLDQLKEAGPARPPSSASALPPPPRFAPVEGGRPFRAEGSGPARESGRARRPSWAPRLRPVVKSVLCRLPAIDGAPIIISYHHE
jgi:transposase